ncbi:MAG: EutN/CcmL family microcompartment protein [Planctomycetales bacterium]|nr:EutN/CcmL family microcompartment protein [Planctomycetales bacterium]
MQTARVVGKLTSTIKHASMQGCKLLVVQPLMVDGASPDGYPVVAADGLGAGNGELVMISSDGRFARELLQTDKTPLRWTVTGICDP